MIDILDMYELPPKNGCRRIFCGSHFMPRPNIHSRHLFISSGVVNTLTYQKDRKYTVNITGFFAENYSSVVFRIFVSKRRLYPNQPVLFPAPRKASIIVSIFASVLSAKFNARASKIAGFFGEPYSNSP